MYFAGKLVYLIVLPSNQLAINKIEQNLMDKSKVRNSEMSMIKKYVSTMA